MVLRHTCIMKPLILDSIVISPAKHLGSLKYLGYKHYMIALRKSVIPTNFLVIKLVKLEHPGGGRGAGR